VHSPADDGLAGVSLDLDLQGGAIAPPAVIPEPGVTLIDVDVSSPPYHIEAMWTSRPLEHAPIVKLVFAADPGLHGFQTPVNVSFTRGAGGTEPGVGVEAFAGCCIDCTPCSHGLYIEDHVIVPVGGTAVIQFEWDWNCYTYGGHDFTAADTRGWVASWEPAYGFDWTTCGPCFLPRFPGSISVDVPDGTPVGTTSTLTLAGLNNSRTVTLEAADSVPTEATTWGHVKALYEH
jgi:hypothetical protein